MLYLIAAVRCNLFAPIKSLFKLLLPHACRTPMVDFFLHLNVSMFPSTVILKTKGSPEISFEAAGIKPETSQIRGDAVNHLTATIDTLRMFSVQKMGPRKTRLASGRQILSRWVTPKMFRNADQRFRNRINRF